jgi:hypothetical protein
MLSRTGQAPSSKEISRCADPQRPAYQQHREPPTAARERYGQAERRHDCAPAPDRPDARRPRRRRDGWSGRTPNHRRAASTRLARPVRGQRTAPLPTLSTLRITGRVRPSPHAPTEHALDHEVTFVPCTVPPAHGFERACNLRVDNAVIGWVAYGPGEPQLRLDLGRPARHPRVVPIGGTLPQRRRVQRAACSGAGRHGRRCPQHHPDLTHVRPGTGQ